MLDFYIINDDTSKPDYPEQIHLQLAGSINADTFEHLQAVKIIEDRYDYYKDFRFSSVQVKQKYELILSSNSGLRDNYKKIKTPEGIMLDILKIAISMNCGLIAYCD
jgi:hypothetical protein